MAQAVRSSPQPMGGDDGSHKDGSSGQVMVTAGVGLSVTDISGRTELQPFDAAWPAAVDDAQVLTQTKAMLVPCIAERRNTTLLLSGHAGSGKTCLLEQVLPVLLEGLKSQIVSADEAHQEALNMGISSGASPRRGRSASPQAQAAGKAPEGARGLSGAPSAVVHHGSVAAQGTHQDAAAPSDPHGSPSPAVRDGLHSPSPAGSIGRRGTKAQRASSAGRSSSSRSRAKYCLLLARMPRDIPAVEMAEVDASVQERGGRPLLPKLQAASLDLSELSPKKDMDERSPSRWRQALERAKSPIQLSAGFLTSLGPKNGRPSGEHPFPVFDGEHYFTLESVQSFDKVLKDSNKVFCMSFWLVVDSTESSAQKQQCVFSFFDPHDANYRVSMMLNTNDVGFEEPGLTQISLRDSHNKKLEATFTDPICDGTWHHIVIQFLTVEKNIQFIVDDKPGRQKFVYGDTVAAFHESRPKLGFIGAASDVNADGNRVGVMHLHGSLMDFQMFELYSGKRLAQYSMRHPTAGLSDATFSLPNLTGDVPFEPPRYFPATSPAFDGTDTFINVGTVGDLGLMLDGTTFDVVLRTSVTSERMCLMGVMDTIGKNPGFGLELNTNAHHQLQRYMLTLWIQDLHGAQVRVTSDVSTIFDDRWHTVSVKIVDLANSKFKFRVDGRHCDAVVHPTSGHPHDMIAYTQFVGIGACNHRGQMKRFFRGSIKSVRISRSHDDLDEPIAHWPLNEGPGAVIAMDATSHGFNGVYFLRRMTRGANFFPSDLHNADGSDDDLGAVRGVTRYDNNVVTVAITTVRVEISATGGAREVLHDLIGNRTYGALEEVRHRDFNTRVCADDNRVFRTIPEECYVRITPNDYMATFKAAMGRMDDQNRHSHVVFVLRLGDASFTVIDLASLHKSPKASFNAAQLTWSDTLSMFGNENKLNFAVNATLARVDKLLLRCGTRPQLFKRSEFRRLSAKLHTDDFVSSILAFALVASRESSVLFHYHLIGPRTRPDEALHALLLSRRMRQADVAHAVLVIQNLFRWRKAFQRFRERYLRRRDAEVRREKIALLRKQFPKEILEKEKRLALVILCLDFEYDPSMPPPMGTSFDDFVALPRQLESIGIKTELMLNPSRKNLLEGIARKKEEQASMGASLIVHFIGVGARDCLAKPPRLELRGYWLCDDERSARLQIIAAQRKEMAEFYVDEQYEYKLLYDQLAAALEEQERKNAKKKKKGGDKNAPAVTLPTRGPRPSKDSVLASMAKWEATLAPHVARVEDDVEATSSSGASFDALHDGRRSSGTTTAEQPAESDAAHMMDGTHEQPPIVLCCGDTRAELSEANTIRWADLRDAVIPHLDPPRRGEHSIASFDCIAFPSRRNAIGGGGCGALVASSGEAISVVYRDEQKLLLTYYLRRCVQGAAAECVRIGKNDPPPHVTVETASVYLQKKLDPTEGRFPVRSLSVRWFGEFVGDVYLAHKIPVKKDERRKIKAGNAGKKVPVRLELLFHVPIRPNDHKAVIQQKLTHMFKVPTEVKKLNLPDAFTVHLKGVHFATLRQHSLARKAVEDALTSLIPKATKLKCFPQPLRNGTAVVVQPIHSEERSEKEKDDEAAAGQKDQKQIAMELYAAMEKRAVDVEDRIMRPLSTLAVSRELAGFACSGGTLKAIAVVSLTEDECLKLDRHARLGLPFIDDASLLSARCFGEKELQEMEQIDRLLALEEARRQSEAKLRLVQEAEARKKAEEALAKLHQRKDAVLDKVQQLKGLGGPKPDDIDYILSVPLPEALAPAVELLAQTLTKDNVDGIAKAQVAAKLADAASKTPAVAQDARFLAACLRLIAAMAPLHAAAADVASRCMPWAAAACAQQASGAQQILRQLPVAIDALSKSDRFVAPGVVRDVGLLWGPIAVDNKSIVAAQWCTLAGGLKDLVDLLNEPTVSIDRNAFIAALPAAALRGREDDVISFLSWVGMQDASQLPEVVIQSFLLVCKGLQGALPDLDHAAKCGVDRLCLETPVAVWSADMRSQYAEVFATMGPGTLQDVPSLQQLSLRLQA